VKPIKLKKVPWKKMRRERRTVLVLLMLVVILILAYEFAFVPLVESQKNVRQELALKKKLLARYEEYIKSGKDMDEELNQKVQQVEAIQAKLLPGETPQINAANLQEILRKLSERNGVQIRSFRIGEPKEMNFYLKIPVTIEVTPTKSVAALTYFLYDIENDEKLLVISDLDLTAPNMRNPSEIQGSVTVVGFTKNTHPKGKAKEG
jgi:Tfp pilus assembly protein PilO